MESEIGRVNHEKETQAEKIKVKHSQIIFVYINTYQFRFK